MKLYALAGPPGAGKTYFKDHDDRLKKLPFFDVADVYADFPGMGSQDAFAELLNRITEFAAVDNAGQDIVVEALLREDSPYQRPWLGYVGEANGYEIEYIEFDTPLEVCLQRVEADWQKSKQTLNDRARYEARKRIIQAQNG